MKNKRFIDKSIIFFAIAIIVAVVSLFTFPQSVIADTAETTNNLGLESIKCEEAQFFTKGSSNILVGVLDSGRPMHSALDSAMSSSMEHWSFYQGSRQNSNILDIYGHSTKVSGIINQVAPNVKLVSYKVFNNDGKSIDIDSLIAAIKYATETIKSESVSYENKIKILNYSGAGFLSITTGTGEQKYNNLIDAIYDYGQAGGIIIVAAGNKYNNMDNGNKMYPAALTDPNFSYVRPSGSSGTVETRRIRDYIITVGALQTNDNGEEDIWVCDTTTDNNIYDDGSNYGIDTVDIYAPGKDIYSTYLYNQYGTFTGTSFAAPFVTGVVALMRSINPFLTPAEIKQALLGGGEEIELHVNDDSQSTLKALKLNAFNALQNIAYSQSIQNGEVAITGLNFVPQNELLITDKLSYARADYIRNNGRVERNGYTITKIDDSVFANCTSLTDLILPESITSIGNNAFENCTSLTEMSLPDGVTSIGNNLFRGCSGLISISMSSDVESIGDSAFAYCESLENLTIPYLATEIGSRAFEHCESLQSITIPSKVQWIGDYCFSNCTGLTEVVFDSASVLTSIGNSAFEDCTSLESIDIPKGIQYIYNVTFCNCSALTSIKIPSSVGYVGNNAFAGCDALATVYYGNAPDNESEGEVTEGDWNNISIGVNNSSLISARKYYYRSGQPDVYGYFWHYEGNTLQKWPFYGLRYTLINNGTEYEISKAGNLKGEIEIPSMYNEKPVTRIARWGFANSVNITGVCIPSSINKVYGSSFANCPNIESITVDSANSVYMSSGNCLIARRTQILVAGCKISVLPQWVKEIGDYAFAGCTNLTSITIPGSVVTIGESAFEDCRGLTSFIMQSVLQTIGNNALKNCSGITNVSIPDSVTSIGNYAFYGLGFTSVTVPGGVLSIGQNAFGGNNLTAINVDTGNTCYYSHGGVLFGAEGVLLSCPSAKSGNYDIPDGTTEIGDYAFYGCWQLTGITIINNVTSIGEYAFWGCTQLAYITISADSMLESIGSSAFFECFGVSEITIPQSVTFIGATAFGDWTEDQTIVMNVDVSFVWQWDVDWALQCYAQINWGGNSAIATEGLQYTLTNVGYEVSVGSSLSDNDNNGTVVIPAVYNGYPVVGVAESGFLGCQGLVKVMFIGNNLMYIGNNAFADCSNLTAINIPHGVTHIGQEAFCSCIQLQSINLPQTIEEIYCTAFKECDNLKSIMIQGGLTYIEVDTFAEINEYTIYTENGSDNPEWHFINFSPSCVVFYNCTFSEDGAFVVSILVQGENYVNANPTAPCREGYVFAGWTTTLGGDVEYDMEDAVSGAIIDTVLYAVWEPVGE